MFPAEKILSLSDNNLNPHHDESRISDDNVLFVDWGGPDDQENPRK
jgi:hypothetical protein